ncbi:uncharacterized protein LOC143211367 isoform X2 [Lasioglossum baleicum]|uniref:uncharacterized protein LOC143211367 isoform X2 n=1 Tax=Lasioglossum baleicum TaxID=434251 RepID=UPI003FCEA2D3
MAIACRALVPRRESLPSCVQFLSRLHGARPPCVHLHRLPERRKLLDKDARSAIRRETGAVRCADEQPEFHRSNGSPDDFLNYFEKSVS